MMIKKFCRTCALVDPESYVCQMNRRKVDLDKDFCSKYVEPSELGECAYCGQLFMRPGYLEQLEDGSFIEFCHSCQEKFGTCAMCSHLSKCQLADERVRPDLPVMVIKTIQQGNMRMQTQIVNPARIDAICKAECECWDGEGCARRDFGCCAKYNQKTVN